MTNCIHNRNVTIKQKFRRIQNSSSELNDLMAQCDEDIKIRRLSSVSETPNGTESLMSLTLIKDRYGESDGNDLLLVEMKGS